MVEYFRKLYFLVGVNTDCMTQNELLATVEQHPRMIGFLFTMSLVLAQAGSAAANISATNPGP